MKTISIVGALVLSSCVTIEMPGVVSDMVKVAKDVYGGPTSDTTEPSKTSVMNSPHLVLFHSYVGLSSQTEAEIKQMCVKEAAQKLSRIAAKERGYTVIKMEVVTLNNHAFANCELGVQD